VRSSLRRLFKTYREFKVLGEAVDGQDAIDEAERLKPDLIILDLAMPVMTGLEAAPSLRKMLPDAVLIMFTHHNGHPVEILAKEAGIHAVVPKTQAASRLIALAQELLARHPPHRAQHVHDADQNQQRNKAG
jgi:DNA-binding NarL/FixJ family response regulator